MSVRPKGRRQRWGESGARILAPMSPPAATTSDRRGLLRAAALAPPDAALAAWTAWRAGADRWRFDPASDWWLPLVWWNLRAAVTDAADVELLREHYRRAWIHHQHLTARVAPALDAVRREGIDALQNRRYVHAPGLLYRWGGKLTRLLPQRFFTGQVAAQYRRSLEHNR